MTEKRSRACSHSFQERMYVECFALKELRDELVVGWDTPELDRAYDEAKTTVSKAWDSGEAFQRKLDGYYRWSCMNMQPHRLLTKGYPPGARTFLDIGSAPGGMAKYLNGDLGWKGHVLTLPEKDGGMPMLFRSDTLDVVYGDFTTALADIRARVPEDSVDFVIAGAVADKGHRGNGDRDEDIYARIVFAAAQVKLAVDTVKEGGSIMTVFGPSDSSAFFYLVAQLQTVTDQPIQVLPTMHVEKTPVYILVRGVAKGKDLKDGADEERAWKAFKAVESQMAAAWSLRKKKLAQRRMNAMRTFKGPKK
jgi:23S rRNA U2552 (ribose-2'-O)-methylase RlmE/FtsJ